MQTAVQRVIQTNLFFNPSDIKWKFPELVFNTPGISMVFFRGNSNQVKWHDVVSNPVRRSKTPIPIVRAFLDSALQNAPLENVFESTRAPVSNGPIIDLIFDQDVITENSPAESTAFSKLLGAPSIITIGTLVGIAGFSGHPMLFISVPTGILAVGACAVVLEWLRRGGGHLIDRALKPELVKPARGKTQIVLIDNAVAVSSQRARLRLL